MNKLLIVLLAMCLVSVQAFVRREAPANNPVDVDKLTQDAQNAIKKLSDQVKSGIDSIHLEDLVKKAQEALPEIQKHLDEVMKTLGVQSTPAPAPTPQGS